ncbi:DUF3618 domain-containing protein [Arcanobacterium pinnipediorum]|uniref:DUF3618 domain-containing protein n=1 Tax=Arcanobacterium pinnipediorum TaxID=1503041 RepID=A0ABY5AIA4_9ACTO|nr:DUF3618 domain-containing protein [Arcanobacterium pinnipediorum]USR79587.1 DUF3618 domain-containing protein [Arcanobacterium pinnipediorum]
MSNINEAARAAANAKRATDYEAPADVEDLRSASEIQKDIERVREELTATVNELAAKLDPEVLKEDLKVAALGKVDEVKAKAQSFAHDAAAGDMKAIGIIAGVALGVAALIVRKIMK